MNDSCVFGITSCRRGDVIGEGGAPCGISECLNVFMLFLADYLQFNFVFYYPTHVCFIRS